MTTKNELDDIHHHNIDKKNRIIYLHSDYDSDESIIDYKSASKFIKNIDYLSNISENEITIKIISDGGNYDEGMAIYDAIANCKCPITTINYANAVSMSSIVIQAADKRLLTKNTSFMVHYGLYQSDGDMREVKSAMDFYSKTNEIMLNIYAKRCIVGQFAKDKRLKQSELRTYIKKQIDEKTAWWMSAEEAVYMGFVDEII